MRIHRPASELKLYQNFFNPNYLSPIYFKIFQSYYYNDNIVSKPYWAYRDCVAIPLKSEKKKQKKKQKKTVLLLKAMKN